MFQKSDRNKRLESLEPSRLLTRALSRDELRNLDESAEKIGQSTLSLMENAGRGAARLLLWAMSESGFLVSDKPVPKVLVLSGSGNNGGDGAVLARHLDSSRMASVNLVWIVPAADLRGLAPTQQKILEQSTVNQFYLQNSKELTPLIESADWIVDGLFGTGLTRPILSESLAGQFINQINSSGKPILALDIPSGLDADTSEVSGMCVTATITASFVSTKKGFLNPDSTRWTGIVEVIDIGLPRKLLMPFE